MGNVRKEKFIKDLVKDWKWGQPFTQVTFAYWFNQIYSKHSMSASGFRTYFLKMEKEGLIKINRDENDNIINYESIRDTP